MNVHQNVVSEAVVAEPLDATISPGAPPRRLGTRGVLIVVTAGLIIIVFDQVTKAMALDRLSLGRPVHVSGPLDWELVYNRGSAFGLGQGSGPVIGVFACVIAIMMLALARNAPKVSYAVVFGVVAGGALGNVIDRLFRAGSCPGAPCDGFMGGAVIDFIHVDGWPWVFNGADMAIVCGVIVIAVGSVLVERSS